MAGSIINYVMSLLVLLLLQADVFNAAVVSGQLKVTSTPGPGERMESMADKKCYDRSTVSSGGFHEICHETRHCFPEKESGIDIQQVYFRSNFSIELLGGTKAPNFTEVDSKLKAEFGHIFIELKKKNTVKAKTCLTLGSYLACSSFYPFCLQDHQVLPCRSLCEMAEEACDGITGFAWPSVFNCSKYPADESRQCMPSLNCDECSIPPPSAPSAVVRDGDPAADESKCTCNGHVRERYSKNVILEGVVTGSKFDFLANVTVLKSFATKLNGECQNAYEVKINENFDANCDFNDDFSCGNEVIIYTKDYGTCDCVTKHITVGTQYIMAGTVSEDGKWILDGNEPSIISTQVKGKNKLRKWVHGKGCLGKSADKTRRVCPAADSRGNSSDKQ